MADAWLFSISPLKSHEAGQFNPKLTLKKNLLSLFVARLGPTRAPHWQEG
jgi:hypothetical protein